MKEFFKSIWNTWFYQWTLPLKLTSVGIVLLVILAFWLFSSIKGCQVGNYNKKLEKQREEIRQGEKGAAVDETIANVQENVVKEKEIKANEKANISKQAEANFNAVVNRDSSEFDSDYQRTIRAYCADPDHKRESICLR